MSAIVYDGLIRVAAVLIGLGVFLISLAVLDILLAWLTAGLLAALSPSVGRAAQVQSALGAMREHDHRRYSRDAA